jgi:hypothetical protein
MQIQEYNETAAALAVLREKYCTVFDVQTVKGMADAREARADVRSYRIGLEKLRVEIKAPALERARLIDAEAKRITGELLAIEEPIDQQIKNEETRKAEERAAKERAEQNRVAAIQSRIAAIRNWVGATVHLPAAIIKDELANALALQLSESDFQELMPYAIDELNKTRNGLQEAFNNRLVYEAEAARVIAEREELARLRQQEEERKANQAKIDAEAKAKAEQEAAAIRQQQEAEAARIAAAQRELDERQRKIDEEEVRQAEDRRQKEIADAKTKAEADAEAIRQQQEAKARNTRKRIMTPLQELENAIGVGKTKVSDALRAAYEMGYAEGIKAGRIAA